MLSPPWCSVCFGRDHSKWLAISIMKSQKNMSKCRKKKKAKDSPYFICCVFEFVPTHQHQCLTNLCSSLFLLNTQRRKSRYAELDFEVSTSLYECVCLFVCLRGRMRRRNDVCLFGFYSWHLYRSAAFAKELLQGFKNDGLNGLCWMPGKGYLLQLNKWVVYIGSCLIYGPVASV